MALCDYKLGSLWMYMAKCHLTADEEWQYIRASVTLGSFDNLNTRYVATCTSEIEYRTQGFGTDSVAQRIRKSTDLSISNIANSSCICSRCVQTADSKSSKALGELNFLNARRIVNAMLSRVSVISIVDSSNVEATIEGTRHSECTLDISDEYRALGSMIPYSFCLAVTSVINTSYVHGQFYGWCYVEALVTNQAIPAQVRSISVI